MTLYELSLQIINHVNVIKIFTKIIPISVYNSTIFFFIKTVNQLNTLHYWYIQICRVFGNNSAQKQVRLK